MVGKYLFGYYNNTSIIKKNTPYTDDSDIIVKGY